LKILHIDEQSGFRGGEQQASWLMQGLVKAGHRCWLAARPDSALLNNAHGGIDFVPVPVPLRHEGDLVSAWRLARIVKREAIDLIHAHSSHAHSIALLTRMLAGRGKVVVHRRVSNPPKGHLLNRLKYRMPDRFLCVSEAVAGVLEAYGVGHGHAVTVPSAVDLSRLDVAPADRNGLGLAEDSTVILSAGALVKVKDHETLIKAFAAIRPCFPRAVLVLAGGGPLESALREQIRALQLEDAVQMLGHREDVPALLGIADLYVSSSLLEGLGTSVLEALAARVPVVATKAGGIGEMVRTGETGILVPSGDPEALARAMDEALSHPKATEDWKANGRALVEQHYTAERMVAGTIAVYEELLQV